MNLSFKGKKVLVMGLGLLGGGAGVAKFFAKEGAQVTVTDLKDKKELETSLKELNNFPIRYVLGKHEVKDFKTHDLVIRNPAVPLDSPFLAIAKKAGVLIEMESGIFFQLCPSKNIIGVTGTKGKTTTTLLIGEMLKRANYKVVVGGNLRISTLELLEKVGDQTWVVLELSSWQLEGLITHRISPHVAVITNIMPDHLNRYHSFAEYIWAKKIIFRFQKKDDIFVLSKDQEITKNLAREAKSQVVFFSQKTLPQSLQKMIKLPGIHNLLNVSCAYVVSKALGVSDDVIFKSVKNFSGVPDRLENVRELEGITFVNDTTATTPEATIAALSSFKNPVVLLCGGSDKNLNFSQLGKIVNKKAKTVLLLEGSATDKIEKEVDKKKIAGRFANLKEAIWAAKERAVKGDVVLLSPSAASFGMFENEFDRGEQFRRIVSKLVS